MPRIAIVRLTCSTFLILLSSSAVPQEPVRAGAAISPVAIFATMMALPITSAGRFSPLGLGAWISSWDAAYGKE